MQQFFGGMNMKKALITLAAVSMMFSLTMLNGCARQNMNDPMDSSMDTMSEEKMDSGMGAMQEDGVPEAMENMQDKDMEKSMEKTMK
jgi:Flp pilus assembly protein TadD